MAVASSEQAARELRNTQIATSLRFLRGSRPLDGFLPQTNKELTAKFEALRIPAANGIGYCMDERPMVHGTPDKPLPAPLGEEGTPPKAAMVAGAAGWAMYYRLMGLDFEHAVAATEELYKRMGWGQMELHNDDHHGHITDLDELKANLTGCGALRVKDDALAIVYNLLHDEMPDAMHKVEADVKGEDYITAFVNRGAKVIPLTKDHKTKQPNAEDNAAVVVNMKKGTTVDREAAYDRTPCFGWDAGTTLDTEVLRNFNRIMGEEYEKQTGKHHGMLSERHFLQLQAAMHLTVGMLLDAVQMGPQGNVVILPA